MTTNTAVKAILILAIIVLIAVGASNVIEIQQDNRRDYSECIDDALAGSGRVEAC